MPVVTIAICLITVFVTYRGFVDAAVRDRLIFDPQLILAEKQWYRLVSSALLHADWPHCIFNLLSLYFFGPNVEAAYGGAVLLAVYVAAELGGSLLSLFVHRHHEYSALGASGAVAGVLFASIFLNPGSKIHMLFIPIGIPGWIYALLFLGGCFIASKRRQGASDHESHFGGAFVGLLAALVIAPQLCLAMPFHYFGALALAVACLASVLFDPMGLRAMAVPNEKPNIRYQRYDEAHALGEKKAEMDRLLDRIAEKGMHAISASERRRLEELSKEIGRR